MSTFAIIATTAAVTAVVVSLVFVAYILFGARVCLHAWGRWEEYGTVNLFITELDGVDRPVGRRIVSQRKCTKCGKTIMRRQRA